MWARFPLLNRVGWFAKRMAKDVMTNAMLYALLTGILVAGIWTILSSRWATDYFINTYQVFRDTFLPCTLAAMISTLFIARSRRPGGVREVLIRSIMIGFLFVVLSFGVGVPVLHVLEFGRGSLQHLSWLPLLGLSVIATPLGALWAFIGYRVIGGKTGKTAL